MEQRMTNVHLWEEAAMSEEMRNTLWAQEILQLKQSEKFRMANKLQSPNEKEQARAWFKLARKIIGYKCRYPGGAPTEGEVLCK